MIKYASATTFLALNTNAAVSFNPSRSFVATCQKYLIFAGTLFMWFCQDKRLPMIYNNMDEVHQNLRCLLQKVHQGFINPYLSNV